MASSLVFVYNADSGLFSALADSAHKLLRPDTYECNLCRITYTALGMKKEWREFVSGLGLPVEFVHRDELRSKYGVTDVALPAVFRTGEAGRLEEIVSAQEINACNSVVGLKALVESKLGRG